MTGYHTHTRAEVRAQLDGRDLRVLELGCGAGRLGAELLAEGVAREVHGVELDEEAGKRAESVLTRVHHGDVSQLGELDLDPPYDLVLATDVLEHIADPWTVVRAIARLVTDHGSLVASVPNVRFVRVVVPLVLAGRFRYEDSGVLDRTHLRFFTRSSLPELFDQGLWNIERTARLRPPAQSRLKKVVAPLLGDFGVAQFLVVARRRHTGLGSVSCDDQEG